MRIVRCYDCNSLEDEVRDCGAWLTECSECRRTVCTDCGYPTPNGKQVLCRTCNEKKVVSNGQKEEATKAS